jgi:hypothetical protein
MQSSGQSLRAVAEEDYAVTLWTYLQVEEDARLARYVSRSERLDLAALLALATHAPKELDRVRRDLLAEVRGDRTSLREKESRIIDRLRAMRRARRLPATTRPDEPDANT